MVRNKVGCARRRAWDEPGFCAHLHFPFFNGWCKILRRGKYRNKNTYQLIGGGKFNEVYDKKFRYYFTSVARSYVGGLNDAEIFNDLENNGIFRSEVFKICKEISKTIDELTPSMLLKRIIDDFNFYEKLQES